MVDDPSLYAEKIVGALRNQNAGVAPVATQSELINRPLTREEIAAGYIDNFAGAGITKARPPTVFEQRHLAAQRNAALPVEQGGLGLGPQNTAMERARAMGAVNAYHGSPNEIVGRSFDRKVAAVKPTNTFDSEDANVFASSSPTVASEYAQIGKTSTNPYDEFYSLPVEKRNELLPLFNEIADRSASRDDIYSILKSITQSGNKEGAYENCQANWVLLTT